MLEDQSTNLPSASTPSVSKSGTAAIVKASATRGAQSPATSPDHPNETDDYGPLMKALGTTDRDFVKGLFGQLFSASARGADKFDGEELFFTLGVIKDTKPRDQLDAMHVAQMAAVHMAR